jgi:hypothetical protein
MIYYQRMHPVNAVDLLCSLGLDWGFWALFWEGFVAAIGKQMVGVQDEATLFFSRPSAKMQGSFTSFGGDILLLYGGPFSRLFPVDRLS